MRRKALQDIANTLCQMLVGWRMGSDLEVLADLPDGAIDFDLLGETAVHSAVGPINLGVTGELSSWLRKRLNSLAIPMEAIAGAKLQASFRTDRVATNRKKIVSFDWACESALLTDEREYRGQLAEKHTWHSRAQLGRQVS